LDTGLRDARARAPIDRGRMRARVIALRAPHARTARPRRRPRARTSLRPSTSASTSSSKTQTRVRGSLICNWN
jgi:hypothetical protein